MVGLLFDGDLRKSCTGRHRPEATSSGITTSSRVLWRSHSARRNGTVTGALNDCPMAPGHRLDALLDAGSRRKPAPRQPTLVAPESAPAGQAGPGSELSRRLALGPVLMLSAAGGAPQGLPVSSPDDPEEREADAVADRIMRTTAESCDCGGSCGDCGGSTSTLGIGSATAPSDSVLHRDPTPTQKST